MRFARRGAIRRRKLQCKPSVQTLGANRRCKVQILENQWGLAANDGAEVTVSGDAVTVANSTRAEEYEATAGRIFREYRSESRPD